MLYHDGICSLQKFINVEINLEPDINFRYFKTVEPKFNTYLETQFLFSLSLENVRGLQVI